MSKRRGWSGHLFASNVGVLPTEGDGCTRDARLVLSMPADDFSRRFKKRRKQLRKELLRGGCDETSDVRLTIDARVPGRP